MLTCPRDHRELRRAKVPGGVVFVCAQCGGRAMTMPMLRRHLPSAVARALWVSATTSAAPGLPCPVCRRTAVRTPLDVDGDDVVLDVCRGCACVWFDCGERSKLPDAPPAPPPDGLPPEVRQRLAIEQVKEMAQRAREWEAEEPNLSLARLPALFGMPVELSEPAFAARAWCTWSTALVVAVVSVVGFYHPRVVSALELVPRDMADSLGATLVTPFFVHANWVHLLGNLWFLVVFGDDLEHVLGRRRWFLLLGIATLLGSVAQVMGDPQSWVPCVGASGGISGFVLCYALAFPEARLGMWFFARYSVRPVWVTFSARTGLLCWFVLQAILLWKQLAGLSSVSALAHLGGVLGGVVVWLDWRNRGRVA
ncbi:MAG TPA: rhomboid family intramembrane serine protease [Planctomycetota bacterium]|nr:rhomboid family intramembrane serine protease [Planctomycetota bacterium]